MRDDGKGSRRWCLRDLLRFLEIAPHHEARIARCGLQIGTIHTLPGGGKEIRMEISIPGDQRLAIV